MPVSMSSPRILLADDQPDVLTALRILLKSEGFATTCVDNPDALYREAQSSVPALVLMDLNYTRDTTSGQEGLDLLSRLANLPSPPPVGVMTAWGSIELAVEAMQRGARDFVLKPWDNSRLLATVRKHLRIDDQPAEDPLQRELAIARQVQAQLLPQHKPALRTLEVDGHCRQVGLIGGDSFDYLDLEPGRLGLVLADISGKGISAALLMSNLQAALRSLAWQAPKNLPLLLRTLNLQFLASTSPERYATLFFGDYDDNTRTLRYANCGHPPPVIARASGSLDFLESTALPLGIMEQFQPAIAETTLAPGDTLIVFSDGATEPFDDDGSRLASALRNNPSLSAEDFTSRLAAELTPPPDDITLLLARGL
jgi:sigma-B regulation protein RsbU (phosphoserine phosphatase)